MLHNNMTVILQWTTASQLETVKDELLAQYYTVGILWRKAMDKADCTDQIDNDLDNLYNALENMLCDLEVPGFEREDGRCPIGDE